MTQRLDYIDSMKGFSMILVIMGHIFLFCGVGDNNVFLDNIVLVNMPLFLFLNGLVMRRNPVADKAFLPKKFMQIMVPFFCWGGLITLYRHEAYTNFLLHFWKFGYWYLIVLFELIVILYCIDLIQYVVEKWIHSRNIRNGVNVFLIILGYFGVRLGVRCLPGVVIDVTSYFQILEYYPYFFLGYLMKCFDCGRILMKYRSTMATVLIIAVPVLWYVWNVNPLCPVVITLFLRISIILLIYMIFVEVDAYMNKTHEWIRKCNGMMITIGRHTMAIYMIQFFLFGTMNFHGFFIPMYEQGNLLILLIVAGAFSVLLSYICIFFEKVILLSRPLGILLLGKK